MAKQDDLPNGPPNVNVADQVEVTVDPTESSLSATANESTVSSDNIVPSNTPEANPPTTQAQVQPSEPTSTRDDTTDLLQMAADNLPSQDTGIDLDINQSKLQNRWSSKRSASGTHVSNCSADLLECFRNDSDRLITDENNNQVCGSFTSPTLTEVSYTRRNESLSRVRRNSVIESSNPTHETEYRTQFRRKESTSKASLKKPTDHLNAQSLSTPSESSVDTSVGK